MNYVGQQSKQFHMVAVFAVALVALSFGLTAPAVAQSCTDSWTGADGNNEWSDPNNWSTGSVPGSSDTACVLLNGAAVNQYNNQDSVANLAIGSTDSFTLSNVPNTNNGFFVDGTFIINNGQIVIPYTTSNQTGTNLALTSGGNVTLSGTGSIVISSGSGISGAGPGGTLVNQSTITGAGNIENDITLNNTSSGVVNANQSSTPLYVGRFLAAGTNAGLMEATGGGQLVIGSIDLNNVGGTLSASGTGSSVTFAGQGEGGQTITGGTFTTSSGGVIYTDNSTTLDGTNGNTITNAGTLILPAVGNNPGSSFQGAFNNTGSIQILSNASSGVGLNIPAGQTFTLSGSGSLTMGDGTSNAYNNNNSISGNIFVNQQLVQGTGAIQHLNGFTNTGTVNANIPVGTNGLQLTIYSTGTTSNTGTLEATKGGGLFIQGEAINNKGGTVKAVGKNSYVNLNGMTLSGGKISSSGGGVIYNEGGALIDGATEGAVTSTATILVPAVGNNANGNFQGAVTNNGTIQILANAGGGVSLGVPGGETFTLSGTGSIIMGDGTSNAYNNQNYISGNGSFVNEQMVQGAGAIQHINGFTNNGTVNANMPVGSNGLQLVVYSTGTTSNTGIMEATNGGYLYLEGGNTINNAGGTVEAIGTNSTVTMAGMTMSGGTFSTSGGGVINDQQGTLLDGTTNPVVIDGTLTIPNAGNNPGVTMQGTIKNTGTIALLPNPGGAIGIGIPGGETLTVTGIGDLIMGDGTNNSYNNNVQITDNGTLVNQSTITGSGQIKYEANITNQGTISANVPEGSAGVLLEVCCEGSGGEISNSGTMEAANGGGLEIFPNNNFTNTGTIEAQVNSTVHISNPFTNLNNNTLTGGTYIVAGTLMIPGNIDTNAAKIVLNGVASQILNPNTNALADFATNAPKASFILSGSQSFESAGTFTNQGSITINKGSTFTVGSGGSYVQTGGKTTVNGKLTVASTEERKDDSDPDTGTGSIEIEKGSLLGNGGTVAAHVSSSGNVIPAISTTSVGNLAVTSYTQSPKGALDANIAGPNSGQFNVLNVTGTATLGGTLNIGLLNSFVPAVGDTFEILTARQVNGTFATVNGTQINDSEHFTVTYNTGNVTLEVVSGP
jgi:hypothetical protein